MYKILYWSIIMNFVKVRGNNVQRLLHISKLIIIIMSFNNVVNRERQKLHPVLEKRYSRAEIEIKQITKSEK